MPRRNALLRLHETLLARRGDLRTKLAGELANLSDFRAADSTTDSVDVAFETSSDEMSSQLAELDARELSQIERVLVRLTQGTYGVCEGGSENCQKRIPVARLNTLPSTTFCINCEREMEKSTSPGAPGGVRATGKRSSTRKRPWDASGSIARNWKGICPATGVVNASIWRAGVPSSATDR
jgi:DnaK suppressor protein